MRVAGLEQPVHAYQLVGAGPARTRLQARASRARGGFEQFRRARRRTRNPHSRACRGRAGARPDRQRCRRSRGGQVAPVPRIHSFAANPRLVGARSRLLSYGKATGYLPGDRPAEEILWRRGARRTEPGSRARHRQAAALDRSLEPGAGRAGGTARGACRKRGPGRGSTPRQRKRAIKTL